MAENTFNFELVSPARKLMEEPVFQVSIPGEAGDIGVRKGHSSLVMTARMGVVEILREENGTAEKLFIAGGFADVTANNTTLLAEEAVPVAELKRAELEHNLKNFQEDLRDAKTDIEKKRAERQIILTEAKMKAATA